MSPSKGQAAPVTPSVKSTMISTTSPSQVLSPESTDLPADTLQQRLADTESELQRTTTQLKRFQRESLVLEERLNVTQAEKEFYKLQLEAVGDGNAKDGAPSTPFKIDDVFVKRTADYEREIGRLKDELRVVRARLDDNKESFEGSLGLSIAKANMEMQAEKERLAKLQKELLSSNPQSSPFRPKSPEDKVTPGPLSPNGGDVDTEAKAEEEHLTALTLKYSHMEDEDEVMIVDQQNTPRVSTNPDAVANGKESEQRRAEIEADLLEISRVIESKEELISQLQCSQAKYSVCLMIL